MPFGCARTRLCFYGGSLGTRRGPFREGSSSPARCPTPVFFCWVPSKFTTMSVKPIHCPLRPHSGTVVNGSAAKEYRNGEGQEEGEEGCSVSVKFTPDIEKKYVHHVYDAIAPHFSATRFAKWPKVAAFLNSLAPGSVVLDAGCGNGKYLGFNLESFYIGCDISAPLVGICAGRGHEVLVADAVNLPYRSGFGDAAISIAVLHHLSTESRRRKAIEELVRIVRPKGLVLITVWAVEQEDRSLLNKWTPLNLKYDEEWISPSSPRVRASSTFTLESIPESEENGCRDANRVEQSFSITKPSDRKSEEESMTNMPSRIEVASGAAMGNHQEYFVPWHLPYHRAEIGGSSASALANGLAKKDDKKGAMVYNRYYHVFAEGELQRLVSGIQNATVVEQFYDKSNWCIILEKKREFH